MHPNCKGKMAYLPILFVIIALRGVAVRAHGHVSGVVINGVYYRGYDPTQFPYMQDPPTVIGWTTDQTDNGFVPPANYTSGDIICHRSAKPAGTHATLAAGDRISIEWTPWPSSHHGPVIDYLANCGSGGCETVDKTTLEFFKIDQVGLVSDSDQPGTWGADELIANNNSWLVEIPPNIEPGFYVLRHEIIALHSAGETDGAQNYPQCFNLQVTGGGSDSPAGTKGEALYGESDPGILINIYTELETYDIPGPTVYSGGVNLEQTGSAVATTTVGGTSPTATTTYGQGAPTGYSAPGSGSTTTNSEYTTTSYAETITIVTTMNGVPMTIISIAYGGGGGGSETTLTSGTTAYATSTSSPVHTQPGSLGQPSGSGRSKVSIEPLSLPLATTL